MGPYCDAQVGYLSPDLFTHSVSYFAEAPLRHHDSSSVSVIVYSCVAKVPSCRPQLPFGLLSRCLSLSPAPSEISCLKSLRVP